MKENLGGSFDKACETLVNVALVIAVLLGINHLYKVAKGVAVFFGPDNTVGFLLVAVGLLLLCKWMTNRWPLGQTQ